MRRFILLLAATALLTAILAAPAAAVNLDNFDVTFEDPQGQEAMDAGGHPFAMRTSFQVATKEVGEKTFPIEAVKDLRVDLVPGFAGTPAALPRCAAAEFLVNDAGKGGASFATGCPDSSAIGAVMNTVGEAGDTVTYASPVYNLAPSPGYAAKLGFRVTEVRVTIDLGLSETHPHRVFADLRNISQALEFMASELVVWGNPAEEAHDPLRGGCLASGSLGSNGEPKSLGNCPAGVPEAAFLVNPRACEGPLETAWQTTSWPNPQFPPAEGGALTHNAFGAPRGFGACGELPFGPALDVQPTSHSAESASGLQVEVQVPGNGGLTDPQGRAASDIKSTTITLPEGMTINPSQAEGLATCDEDDLARESAASAPGAGCPAASKIGTVAVKTPLLPEESFAGELFVATPYENPFGSLIALYMTIKNPQRGVGITLAGKVEPNPKTGQLVTTFGVPSSKDPAFRTLPQVPFSSFRVRLREGGRSPLITPPGCGTFTATAEFVPWAGASPHAESSSFQINSGVGGAPCPAAGAPPFDPGFSGGTLNNAAAAYSPFQLRLQRKDGDQDLVRFDATLPPGALAKLAGVGRCPEGQIAQIKARTGRQELASSSCPASSRIGSVWAGAGVGSQLTYVPGSVYLAGPFAGAPLSVVGVVPAVAGPFDVGVVATRQALTVDPITGIAKVDSRLSEPIPHILAGIPLKVRDIQVSVDRPEFTLNPTSCDPLSFGASIWGGGADAFSLADDSPVARGARFQAADCASLGFKPRLSLQLKGATKRGGHPALRGTFLPRAGDANLKGLVLRLPHSAFLEQSHIRTICTRVQFAAESCPRGAIYGHARAFTPLLDEPLEGPVYLRSSSNPLPDFVADLHGLVDIEAVARIDSKNGGIRATFADTPDAPLTKVVVNMQGGKKGLIVNSVDLCAHPQRANASFAAHNGRRHEIRPKVVAMGCKKGKKGKAKRSAHKR